MGEEFIINAVGDVWFGDHPVRMGHGVRAKTKLNGPEHVFSLVSHLFGDGDVNFCNLESVLSETGRKWWYLPSVEMRGFPECIHALKSCGFNVVNTANNHVMQHGLKAYLETISLLAENKMSPIGFDTVDGSNLVILEKGSIKVGFISYSLHPEEYYKGGTRYSFRTETAILREVKEIKRRFDGLLICSLHWGKEFINYPSRGQVLFARELVDSGINIILGHHPHVLQGIEEYKKGIIAYSLGNFVFDLWPDNTRESMILKIKISSNKNYKYEAIPVSLNKEYQPVLAKGHEKTEIENNISRYNAMIAEKSMHISGDDYKRIFKEKEGEFRLSSYKYLILHINKYPLIFLVQILSRTFIRKLIAALNKFMRIMR